MQFTSINFQSNQINNLSEIKQNRAGFCTPEKQKTKPTNYEPSKKKSARFSDEDVASIKTRLFF